MAVTEIRRGTERHTHHQPRGSKRKCLARLTKSYTSNAKFRADFNSENDTFKLSCLNGTAQSKRTNQWRRAVPYMKHLPGLSQATRLALARPPRWKDSKSTRRKVSFEPQNHHIQPPSFHLEQDGTKVFHQVSLYADDPEESLQQLRMTASIFCRLLSVPKIAAGSGSLHRPLPDRLPP